MHGSSVEGEQEDDDGALELLFLEEFVSLSLIIILSCNVSFFVLLLLVVVDADAGVMSELASLSQHLQALLKLHDKFASHIVGVSDTPNFPFPSFVFGGWRRRIWSSVTVR